MNSLWTSTGGSEAIVWRALAVLAAIACLALVVLVLVVLIGENDRQPIVAVVLVIAAAAAVALGWGAAAWTARGAAQARALGWLVLLASSVFFISFAYAIWIVLLLAAPAVMRKPTPPAKAAR